jgi:hypothetical protein
LVDAFKIGVVKTFPEKIGKPPVGVVYQSMVLFGAEACNVTEPLSQREPSTV